MYLAIVTPVIIYGCVVWCSVLDKTFQWKILDKVQQIAFSSITGGRKSCPLLCLTPLDLYVKQSAARSAIRPKNQADGNSTA